MVTQDLLWQISQADFVIKVVGEVASGNQNKNIILNYFNALELVENTDFFVVDMPQEETADPINFLGLFELNPLSVSCLRCCVTTKKTVTTYFALKLSGEVIDSIAAELNLMTDLDVGNIKA